MEFWFNYQYMLKTVQAANKSQANKEFDTRWRSGVKYNLGSSRFVVDHFTSY